MSVVAICETFGSQGTEIGRALSRALGWEFADREIIGKAAERYGESVMELHHVSEEKPTLWERFTDSTRHYVSCIEATILEMAARGEVVLVGHGAAIILREIPHVLRVRITAPEALRASRVRDEQGLATSQGALEFVREADHERSARMKFLYRVDLDDPLLYDVVINTERMTVDAGMRIIREALHNELVRPTARSVADAHDLSLAAQAKARLLVDSQTRHLRVAVRAAGGKLTMTGSADTEALRQAAVRIVSAVPGVTGVEDEIIVLPIVRRYAGT
jgi:cytidylate kinase